jgi:hypothetical protein
LVRDDLSRRYGDLRWLWRPDLLGVAAVVKITAAITPTADADPKQDVTFPGITTLRLCRRTCCYDSR